MQGAKPDLPMAPNLESAKSQRLMRELRGVVLEFCSEESEPLCARVKDNLFEASDRSTRVDEQNVLLTAYTALIKGSPNFVRMLRQHLPIAVEKAVETDQTKVVIDMTTTQRLKLVEVDDVEREVLILNMVRKLEDFCGDTLSPLTLRICHLKGLEQVHLQLNPFKPETFVRGFTEAWEAFDGNRLSTRVMLRSLNLSNFLPLNALYAELNDFLISNDVMREERYSIRRSAESPAGALWKRSAQGAPAPKLSLDGGGSPGIGGGAMAGNAELAGSLGSVMGAGAALGEAPTGDALMVAAGLAPAAPSWNFNPSRFLHQVTLLLETAGNARQRPSGDGRAASAMGAPDPRLMARLDDLLAARAANQETGGDEASADHALDSIRNEPEFASATEIDRATIEMLARIFRFALEDASIPPTLKVLIGSLQLPVLKAALEDRAFFVFAEHPARQFVDGLARLGVYWSDDPNDALHRSVAALVAQARENTGEGTTLFAKLDADLAVLFQELQQHVSERDAEAIADITDKELRAEAAEEVDLRLHRRVARVQDQPLIDFLNGVWRDVWIERFMQRTSEPERWQEIQDQTDVLLWSILPKSSSMDTMELRQALPALIRCINEGLDQVSWAADQRQAFMDYLMDRQAAAVRAVQSRPGKSKKPVPAAPFPAPAEPEPLSIDAPAALEADVPDDGFERNQWFALDLGLQRPLKYRLSWISPKRTKFILTTRDGGEALVKTLPELNKLLDSGSLLRLELLPLVERALAATVATAA